MAGVYLAHDLWLTQSGELYQLTNANSGMSDVDWEKIGDFGSDIFDKVIQFRKAGQRPTPAPLPVTPGGGGVQVGGGLFGMDTNTLLLALGAVLLFFSMPKSK